VRVSLPLPLKNVATDVSILKAGEWASAEWEAYRKVATV